MDYSWVKVLLSRWLTQSFTAADNHVRLSALMHALTTALTEMIIVNHAAIGLDWLSSVYFHVDVFEGQQILWFRGN